MSNIKCIFQQIAVTCTVAVFTACTGFHSKPVDPSPAATTAYVNAFVTGDKVHLDGFEEEILKLLPALNDPNNEHVLCHEGTKPFCDGASPIPNTRLKYRFVRTHPGIFSKFTKAWDNTQTAMGNGSPLLSLKFDADIKPPACFTSGCPNNPLCSDSCGRPCSACN